MSESGDRKVGTTGSPPPADSAAATDAANTQAKDGEARQFASNVHQSDMTLIMNRARQTGPRIGHLPPPQLPPFKLPTTDAPPAVSIADQSVVIGPRYRNPTPVANELTTTRPGIELGRPLFAVVAIAILLAVGALLINGRQTALGVGVGGLAAAINFWAFTRIGTAMFSGQSRRGAWGLMAIVKLLFLFGSVFLVLKNDLADPLSFLVGYLALPIGIVASQFLGLRADFGNGEGSI